MPDIDEIKARAEAKQTLLVQAGQLGVDVDNRWSVETLAEKVAEAQIMREHVQAQKVREASDTWVYLFKGAWPTSQQKHFAGEVICIPEDMASKWVKAGACRLAMKDEIPQ